MQRNNNKRNTDLLNGPLKVDLGVPNGPAHDFRNDHFARWQYDTAGWFRGNSVSSAKWKSRIYIIIQSGFYCISTVVRRYSRVRVYAGCLFCWSFIVRLGYGSNIRIRHSYKQRLNTRLRNNLLKFDTRSVIINSNKKKTIFIIHHSVVYVTSTKR